MCCTKLRYCCDLSIVASVVTVNIPALRICGHGGGNHGFAKMIHYSNDFTYIRYGTFTRRHVCVSQVKPGKGLQRPESPPDPNLAILSIADWGAASNAKTKLPAQLPSKQANAASKYSLQNTSRAIRKQFSPLTHGCVVRVLQPCLLHIAHDLLSCKWCMLLSELCLSLCTTSAIRLSHAIQVMRVREW